MTTTYTMTSFVGVKGSVTVDPLSRRVTIAKMYDSHGRPGNLDLSEFDENMGCVIPWAEKITPHIHGFTVTLTGVGLTDWVDAVYMDRLLSLGCTVRVSGTTPSEYILRHYVAHPRVELPSI